MPYVYLGFTEMLQSVFTVLFDEVLSPVLETVFYALLDMLGKFLLEAFSELLLNGFIALLKAINFLNSMFQLFSGLAVVEYRGKDMSLLDYVFQLNGISKALAVMTVLGALMAFLFAIYSTGKAMADSPFENAAPISSVLKNGFHSAVMFMLVPFLCIFILNLSTAMMEQVYYSFQYASGSSGETGMDDVLFITVAQDAVKNSSNKSAIVKKYSSNHKYADREKVKKDFTVSKIDYVVGYISGVLIILILMGACLEFIRRIFDLLILYLISPFFSASIALDGGIRFKKWRELFIGKFFSGFGSIFAMKIYLMMVPIFTGSSFSFSQNATANSILKLFLVIGGAWAVYKGQSTLMQILNPEAAQSAEQSSIAMKALAVSGVRAGARGISSAAQRRIFQTKQKVQMAPKASNSSGQQGQAFRGESGGQAAGQIKGGLKK